MVKIIVSGPNQSNELSMLDSDDGSVSPDSPQDIECKIKVFQNHWCLDNAQSYSDHSSNTTYTARKMLHKSSSRNHAQFKHTRVPAHNLAGVSVW